MGIQLTGRCKCGFEGEAYLGSSRSNHGKVFDCAYSCNTCSSLISIDILGSLKTCSECGSEDVLQYAATTKTLSYKSLLNKLPTELLRKAGYHRSSEVYKEVFCFLSNKTFIYLRGDLFCPSCKQNSMHFFTSMYYD